MLIRPLQEGLWMTNTEKWDAGCTGRRRREAIRQAGDGAGVVSKNWPMAADKVNGMFQLLEIDLRLRSVHLILKTQTWNGGNDLQLCIAYG
jgi:hypothetical protein